MIAVSGDGPGRVVRPRAPGEGSIIGTLVAWILIAACLLPGCILAVLVGPIAAFFGDRDRRVAHNILAFFYTALSFLYPGVRVRVNGRENLPDGACILCPNHQSFTDVAMLYRLGIHFKWVIKHELFWVPFFGMAMRAAQYPKVRRGDPESTKALLTEVAQILGSGVPVLSFPEGGRSVTGELQEFQHGSARMAIDNGVPLVPIGIIGTGRLLPKGSWLYALTARVAVHIGTPIYTDGGTRKDVRELTKRLRQGIIEAKAFAQRELEEGKRSDR